MRVGIAADHGGFRLKEELVAHLRGAGHEVIGLGTRGLNQSYDYSAFGIPLARAVAAGTVEREVAICGSGVDTSVCANKDQAFAPDWCMALTSPVEAQSTIHTGPNLPGQVSERKRMETVMKKVTKAGRLLTLGWLAAIFFGCGGLQSQPVSRIVPISSFDQVAGKWEGLSKRMPDMRDHAWVILIISEKGFFHFASNRATGLLLGTGTLHIHDGEVFGKTGTGSGTFTLHDKAGKPVLVVEAALNDGNHYYLELTSIR
jgi:RpiB/LacA/LacB family sugar-phosphate isomerase